MFALEKTADLRSKSKTFTDFSFQTLELVLIILILGLEFMLCIMQL